MSARIGVIGGGIGGLTCALRLSRLGHEVTLFESSDQLGGLGTFFELDGRFVDRFYHCIMPSDDHLLKLIEDLNLSGELYWKNTLMGMVWEGSHYPFISPLDLLRFKPLSVVDRVRLGAVSLALPYLGREDRLDQTPIKDWLGKLYGKSLWERFWKPMFQAKFGEDAANLPSLYLAKRLGREKNVGERGYVHCGLIGLINALDEAISDHGGRIIMSTAVATLQEETNSVTIGTSDGIDHEFDYVISTMPLKLLKRALGDPAKTESLPDLEYQGVVNLLLFLDRPLQNYYWTPILHSDTEFDGAVESSALIEKEQYGNCSAVYLMKYTDRNSKLFSTPDTEIAERWINDFLRIYAPLGLQRENIIEHRVFRAPFVEPSYPLNYLRLKPGHRIDDSRIFLSTTAQVYPNITSWNSSVRVAEETVNELRRELVA